METNSEISSFFDLYNLKNISLLPDKKWIIDKIIPDNSIIIMYGQPKNGKSFIILDISLHIVNNIRWNTFNINKTGIIIYLVGEGIDGLKQRIESWHEYNNIEYNELFYIISFSGKNFYENKFIENLINLGDKLKTKHNTDIALIVIDTLSKVINELDENNTLDMSKFICQIEKIKKLLNTSVFIVHNTEKYINKSMRDSSILLGDIDTSILIKRKNKEISFKVDKQKDGEEIYFKINLIKIKNSLIINFNNIKENSISEYHFTDIKKHIINDNENIYTVYVLLLNNHKFYVGHTKDIVKRLNDHFSGNSSPWVKMNKPIISIYEIIKNVTKNYEKNKTLELMKKFGWQNVRGYAWSQWNMKYPPKELNNYNIFYDNEINYANSEEIRDILSKTNIKKERKINMD